MVAMVVDRDWVNSIIYRKIRIDPLKKLRRTLPKIHCLNQKRNMLLVFRVVV